MGRATFRTRTAPQDTPCPSPSVSKNVTGERADRLRTSESAQRSAPALSHEGCQSILSRAEQPAPESRAAFFPRCAGDARRQGYSGRSAKALTMRATLRPRAVPCAGRAGPPRYGPRTRMSVPGAIPQSPRYREPRRNCNNSEMAKASPAQMLRLQTVSNADRPRGQGPEPCGNGVPSGEGEGRRSSPEAAFRTGLRASGSG